MKLSGSFVMISVESKPGKNDPSKISHYVNLEAEDGSLLRVRTTEEVLPNLKKYRLHQGWFKVGVFNGDMYMNLVDAAPLDAGK